MKSILIIVLFAFTFPAIAQETKTCYFDYWSVGYFGEKITNPGFVINIGKIKTLNGHQEDQKDRIEYSLAFASYIHPKNHIGVQLKPQLSYYHIFGQSFEIGLKTEIGYMRRFYQGETFQVSDNGTVSKKTLAGQNAFLYGAYISLGQNLSVHKNKPIRWFIELGAFWEYPYNSYSLFHPAMSVGISKLL